MNKNHRNLFVGLDTPVPLLNGSSRIYINLDNAASTPSMAAVKKEVDDFLPKGWQVRYEDFYQT
jgi:hypothetical protein